MATSEPQDDGAEEIGRLSVQRVVQVAARYPSDAARILSRNFFDLLNGCRRFDAKLKLTFADHLLQSLHDEAIEQEVDERVLARLSRMSLQRAVRLAAHYPEEGMKLLAVMVFRELRDRQGLDRMGLIAFVNGFLDSFLSEMRGESRSAQGPDPPHPPLASDSAIGPQEGS
jgi:hypothetical protein